MTKVMTVSVEEVERDQFERLWKDAPSFRRNSVPVGCDTVIVSGTIFTCRCGKPERKMTFREWLRS